MVDFDEKQWEAEYQALRAEWREEPSLYASQRLGLNPTWQQRDMLDALREHTSAGGPRAHATRKIDKTGACTAFRLHFQPIFSDPLKTLPRRARDLKFPQFFRPS